MQFARISLVAVALGLPAGAAWADTQIVTLTQVPCQFVESENGKDHHYQAKAAAECEAVNRRTADDRLAAARTLHLKPGRTIFRVTNRNVPYELGFWVRGDGLIARARLPSVSGGGLTEGRTQDYEIDLAPGEYRYSCPLNPTPDYRLVVSE